MNLLMALVASSMAVLAAACTTVAPPEYPQDHPANPAAAAAALTAPDSALAAYRSASAPMTATPGSGAEHEMPAPATKKEDPHAQHR